jgi:hypothetical protein
MREGSDVHESVSFHGCHQTMEGCRGHGKVFQERGNE